MVRRSGAEIMMSFGFSTGKDALLMYLIIETEEDNAGSDGYIE